MPHHPAITALKAARIKRGLTLQQIADAVGVNNASLSKIERGAPASRGLAARLARFFGHEVTEMQLIYPERYLSTNDAFCLSRSVSANAAPCTQTP